MVELGALGLSFGWEGVQSNKQTKDKKRKMKVVNYFVASYLPMSKMYQINHGNNNSRLRRCKASIPKASVVKLNKA